ncbi:MAG TPA: DNA gyrase inhibitor YacG [Candidatus Binatia bacterium]
MRVVKCPQCGTDVDWASAPYRPFCSERCRLIDLGAWLDEKYVIPGPLEDESVDIEEEAEPAGRANGHDDDD